MTVRTGPARAGHSGGKTGRRWTAFGGIVGPAVFIAAWVIAGAVEDGYSPVDTPISRLAAVESSVRLLMNVGLVALGVGLLLFAVALRERVAGVAWVAATVSGLATLGVASFPLGISAAGDGRHGAFAVTGYVSLAAIPLLAARRIEGKRLVQPSLMVGTLALVCLLGSVAAPVAVGALQRAGLLLAHAWVAAMAISLLREN